jgi:hypothetical protein
LLSVPNQWPFRRRGEASGVNVSRRSRSRSAGERRSSAGGTSTGVAARDDRRAIAAAPAPACSTPAFSHGGCAGQASREQVDREIEQQDQRA